MTSGTGLNYAKPGSKKNGLDPADIEGGNFIVKNMLQLALAYMAM